MGPSGSGKSTFLSCAAGLESSYSPGSLWRRCLGPVQGYPEGDQSDAVNTVSWPGTAREHDWFDPAANVTLWALEVGLIDEQTRRRLDRDLGEPTDLAEQVAAVRTIRQTLHGVLAPRTRGEVPPPEAMRDLNGWLAGTYGRRYVDPTVLAWAWVEPTTLTEVMAPVVHNAAEVLVNVDSRRLRYCPSCDWLFHDASRNASRRWCDMADCGSRDKALRYYHRHKRSS